MTQRRMIRLLGPAAIGSAFIGLSLPARTGGPSDADGEDANRSANTFVSVTLRKDAVGRFDWRTGRPPASFNTRNLFEDAYPVPSFGPPHEEKSATSITKTKSASATKNGIARKSDDSAKAESAAGLSLKTPDVQPSGLISQALTMTTQAERLPLPVEDFSAREQVQVLDLQHAPARKVDVYPTPSFGGGSALSSKSLGQDAAPDDKLVRVFETGSETTVPNLSDDQFEQVIGIDPVTANPVADPDPETNALAIDPAPSPRVTVSSGGAPVSDEISETAEEDPRASQTETDLSPGRQVFPIDDTAPAFTYDDELILQLRVTGTAATETIIAYGTRAGIFLPVGELSRLLDLAIQVSDDGNYASGWFLSEERTLVLDLRQNLIETAAGTRELPEGAAQAFEGELFLRTDLFAELLPLEIEPDLRSQAVVLTTKEPFPFEERMRRRAERDRLQARANQATIERWPRQETPWAAISVPLVDVELRAVSDTSRGPQAEGDIRLAGDLAFFTAQSFFSGTSEDGLTAALIELGRRDPDGDLLGPLKATELLLGDVATVAMPVGLRGASGRGAYLSNRPFEDVSVFDEIDFRGVLPDGYEVELYRNDILLGSTRNRVNGQYEFLQIPVDYGLNVFRLVFYGPQGQRREEVRRISVGDGRLSTGQFVYSGGIVERGVNVLGVQRPGFRPDARYGDWQAVGELSYGFTSDFTGIASGAFYQDQGENRWVASGGVRTGLGGLALRGDIAASNGGALAYGMGVGGRALGGGFRLTHFEYSGNFVDEVRSISPRPLKRATEADFNMSANLGGSLFVPLNFRGRNIEFAEGGRQTNASLRGSARLGGLIASAGFDYIDFETPEGQGSSQLAGNFDLATFNRSRTQARASLGYRILPQLALAQVGADVSHAIDDRTVVRASAAYALEQGDVVLGLSAIREFEQFTLGLDGQYDFGRNDYSVALRVGFSFGRDPLRREFFIAPPGLASSGVVAMRAFRDVDGDRVFGVDDEPLEDVVFATASRAAQTDAAGFARLGELGNGNRAVVQVDASSLPDIFMAPVDRGVEIVPRAGRFHVMDFPFVELSEVEGVVNFREDKSQRGVSGLRLQMLDENGEVAHYVRTERGGYFFFEQVEPGTYDIVVDPEQGERLGICLEGPVEVDIGPSSDIIEANLVVSPCSDNS